MMLAHRKGLGFIHPLPEGVVLCAPRRLWPAPRRGQRWELSVAGLVERTAGDSAGAAMADDLFKRQHRVGRDQWSVVCVERRLRRRASQFARLGAVGGGRRPHARYSYKLRHRRARTARPLSAPAKSGAGTMAHRAPHRFAVSG